MLGGISMGSRPTNPRPSLLQLSFALPPSPATSVRAPSAWLALGVAVADWAAGLTQEWDVSGLAAASSPCRGRATHCLKAMQVLSNATCSISNQIGGWGPRTVAQPGHCRVRCQ